MPVPYDEVSLPQQSASTAGADPIRAKIEIQIRPSRSDFPRSQSVNWAPPVPATPERDALRSIQSEWEKQGLKSQDYDGYAAGRPVLIADLYDFEIYRSPQFGHEARRWELISLHHLEVPTSKKLSSIMSKESKSRAVLSKDTAMMGMAMMRVLRSPLMFNRNWLAQMPDTTSGSGSTYHHRTTNASTIHFSGWPSLASTLSTSWKHSIL
jgi:hypothetical protein